MRSPPSPPLPPRSRAAPSPRRPPRCRRRAGAAWSRSAPCAPARDRGPRTIAIDERLRDDARPPRRRHGSCSRAPRPASAARHGRRRRLRAPPRRPLRDRARRVSRAHAPRPAAGARAATTNRVDRFAVATRDERERPPRALARINDAAFGFRAHRSRDVAVETSQHLPGGEPVPPRDRRHHHRRERDLPALHHAAQDRRAAARRGGAAPAWGSRAGRSSARSCSRRRWSRCSAARSASALGWTSRPRS